jgi:hypothetical protein
MAQTHTYRRQPSQGNLSLLLKIAVDDILSADARLLAAYYLSITAIDEAELRALHRPETISQRIGIPVFRLMLAYKELVRRGYIRHSNEENRGAFRDIHALATPHPVAVAPSTLH